MTERKFKVGDKVVSTERGYDSVDGWPNGTIVVNEGGLFRVEFGDGSALAHFEEDMRHATGESISPHYTENADRKSKSLSTLYPKYYKDVSGVEEIDVYATHLLFGVEDASGAIQHASKKLLLSGVRTGGKSKFDDIREARDTLSRWLELNAPTDK